VSYGRVAGVVFGYYGEMSKDASELLSFAAGKIAARTWEKESAGASLDAASARMTRRLYQNWGVASVREVARTKLEPRRWITYVGGNPCASAYALVRADPGRCARDRNLAYALNSRARARGLGARLSSIRSVWTSDLKP